jgi:hypothetical protein
MQEPTKIHEICCPIKVIDIKNCLIIEQIEKIKVMHQIMLEKELIGTLQRDDM